jgi:hypothetical protein
MLSFYQGGRKVVCSNGILNEYILLLTRVNICHQIQIVNARDDSLILSWKPEGIVVSAYTLESY